jgi:hypothetical protein
MSIGVKDAPLVQGVPVRQVTLGWFFKRSLIGIAILLVAMGGLAWLTYASIDPNLDIDSAPTAAKTHAEQPVRVTPVEL